MPTLPAIAAPAGDDASPAAANGDAGAPAPPPRAPGQPEVGGPAAVPDLPPFDVWRRQLAEALDASRRPRTVAATALTDDGRPDVLADPGLHKRPRDLDLPPWQKGRYGSAVGRAVHGVLQTIDLGGADPDAHCRRRGGRRRPRPRASSATRPAIQALVDAALASPTVREAAAHRHWREVYVGVPLGGERTLEGYVDLLYRRADGLVVVDYKTGPAGATPTSTRWWPATARRARRTRSPSPTPRASPSSAVVFVFLTPEGPVDRPLADLAAGGRRGAARWPRPATTGW